MVQVAGNLGCDWFHMTKLQGLLRLKTMRTVTIDISIEIKVSMNHSDFMARMMLHQLTLVTKHSESELSSVVQVWCT